MISPSLANDILEQLVKQETGTLILAAGNYKLDIETSRQPTKVWISFEDHNMAVCQAADFSNLSWRIIMNGFEISVVVNSDVLKINYIVEF